MKKYEYIKTVTLKNGKVEILKEVVSEQLKKELIVNFKGSEELGRGYRTVSEEFVTTHEFKEIA